jgi:hypothetical protein
MTINAFLLSFSKSPDAIYPGPLCFFAAVLSQSADEVIE